MICVRSLFSLPRRIAAIPHCSLADLEPRSAETLLSDFVEEATLFCLSLCVALIFVQLRLFAVLLLHFYLWWFFCVCQLYTLRLLAAIFDTFSRIVAALFAWSVFTLAVVDDIMRSMDR